MAMEMEVAMGLRMEMELEMVIGDGDGLNGRFGNDDGRRQAPVSDSVMVNGNANGKSRIDYRISTRG